MKIYAYEVRQDEIDYFKEYEKKYLNQELGF